MRLENNAKENKTGKVTKTELDNELKKVKKYHDRLREHMKNQHFRDILACILGGRSNRNREFLYLAKKIKRNLSMSTNSYWYWLDYIKSYICKNTSIEKVDV